MPLRDHFRPPLDRRFSWEGLLGCWPTMMIQQLNHHLPQDFFAEPRVHLGNQVEVDVGSFQSDSNTTTAPLPRDDSLVTPLWPQNEDVLTIETDLGEPSEYEVRVYDARRGRRLVATIEIVSPANKDRPEHRRALVAKCLALLQEQVNVIIVDLVTTRQFNLYADLMAMIDRTDPALHDEPPSMYVVSVRHRMASRPVLDRWYRTLAIERPLPTLPLWLTEELAVPLELETSYTDACRMLRIP